MSDQAVKHYVETFEQRQDALAGDAFARQRETGIRLLQEQGFPTRRQENWKYTDVRPILKQAYAPAAKETASVTAADIEQMRFRSLNCHELVFVNGVYAAGLSSIGDLPEGTIVRDLASASKEYADLINEHVSQYADPSQNPFTALNVAFMQHGALICLPAGAVIEQPVNLLYLSGQRDEPFVSYPRNLIIMAENSEATVIESYVGLDDSNYFTNTVTEISLGDNAGLQHYKIQQESHSSYHVGNLHARLLKDSRLVSHSISLGGSLVRNDIHGELRAEGADITLNGLYLASGRQHMDNHTRIDHLEPHTRSYENYRGVLNEQARAVFNGKVVVHRGAQKTDAVQANANLLLSDQAEVDTKPELEIYADDVKCSHGATVGQLDRDMQFYLQSRGIDAATAKSLLTYAFADEVISRFGLRPVRERLEQLVIGRLPDADLIKEFA